MIKVLSIIIIPPSFLILFLLISFFLLLSGRKRIGLSLLIITICFTLLISVPLSSNWLLAPLENSFPMTPPSQLPDADVIVVLGAKVYRGKKRVIPSPELLARLAYGFEIYREKKLPVIVCGGRPGVKLSEAEVMASFLRKLGLPERMIIIEKRSANTWENALNATSIMKSRGWRRVVLVTSAYHMKRAVACFEKQGAMVIPAPADFRIDYEPFPFLLIPSPDSFLSSCEAIREYLALVFYKIFYFKDLW